MSDFVNDKPVKKSLKEYSRGIIGGLIFSLPLLYTMEMWWAGFIAKPLSLLVLLVFTFLLLLGYNRFAGVRPDTSRKAIVIDAVEEMGLGFLVAFLILLMLDRLHPFQANFNEMFGKVAVEAMAVSIGVSIGKSQLGSESGQDNDQQSSQRNSMWSIAVLAICGSMIVGSNVAPTQEILLLGIEAEPVHILSMAIFSVLLSLVVVYFSDFKGAPEKSKMKHKALTMTMGTTVCYLVALATSAFMLWFFDRFDNMSLWVCVAQVIVLGVPASLGASAGRLLIK